jgi:hypothetical protein
MNALQNERLARLLKRTDCWCLVRVSATKMTTLLDVSTVITAHANHGETSSAKRNSGHKPKLSEGLHHTLKRIVSKSHRTTAANMRVELIVPHEDPVSSQTVYRFHQYNIYGRPAVAKYLITENSAER